MYVEKLVKNFLHDLEYLIIWKQTKKLIFNGMIKSHVSHWPPICMFSSWKSNNLINKIHGKSLRVIDDNKESDFQTLQEDHNELTIHQRNLQALMTDVCKRLNGYTPPIVGILFLFRENIHNIRDFQVISNKDIKTARYGLEIICHRTPFLWVNLPTNIRLAISLIDFLKKIKSWKCNSSVSRLCQTF